MARGVGRRRVTPTKLTAMMTQSMPHETAVAYVCSAALVNHAIALGLISEPSSLESGVELIASSHPQLAPLADPSINRMWTTPLTGYRDEVSSVNVCHDPNDCGVALGELYQSLSVEAKGRALCQTPNFVTDLLLDLALDPAVEEQGKAVRMVDPSCGTGHILVRTLNRLMAGRHRFARIHDGRWDCDIAEMLQCVNGIDLDPFAVSIAVYRLLAYVCRSNGATGRLTDVDCQVNVAVADSLLDRDEPLLRRGQYHVVVANPPYVTPKDKDVNEAIRAAYPEVCYRRYSLALPFFQLMNELTVPGAWIAQITANSFMKREFGKRFVEDYMPRFDLQWVIDTSGAYIPGHGTPTVILMHRNRPPSTGTIRTISGIRGEPTRPEDPAKGVVWSAIRETVRNRLSAERFVSASEQRLGSEPLVAHGEEPQTHLDSGGQGTLFDVA